MTQDIEMKEQRHTPSNSISTNSPSALQHLKDTASLVETGAYTREVRRIVRAIRTRIQLRKNLTTSVISAFLNFMLVPGSEVHSRLSSDLPKAKACSYASIARLKNLNRRTVDVLASRLYFYHIVFLLCTELLLCAMTSWVRKPF